MHQLQGKTELVKPADLLTLLQDVYAEKLGLMLRHQAGARHVGQYDINNTYQYIIAREDTHLSWLASAIADMGGAVAAPGQAEPDRSAGGKDVAAPHLIFEEDVRDAQAFVDCWRDRVESLTHARHRQMLRVILGETLEHKRFFEQALAGRKDLLGLHQAEAIERGQVMATRWIE